MIDYNVPKKEDILEEELNEDGEVSVDENKDTFIDQNVTPEEAKGKTPEEIADKAIENKMTEESLLTELGFVDEEAARNQLSKDGFNYDDYNWVTNDGMHYAVSKKEPLDFDSFAESLKKEEKAESGVDTGYGKFTTGGDPNDKTVIGTLDLNPEAAKAAEDMGLNLDPTVKEGYYGTYGDTQKFNDTLNKYNKEGVKDKYKNVLSTLSDDDLKKATKSRKNAISAGVKYQEAKAEKAYRTGNGSVLNTEPSIYWPQTRINEYKKELSKEMDFYNKGNMIDAPTELNKLAKKAQLIADVEKQLKYYNASQGNDINKRMPETAQSFFKQSPTSGIGTDSEEGPINIEDYRAASNEPVESQQDTNEPAVENESQESVNEPTVSNNKSANQIRAEKYFTPIQREYKVWISGKGQVILPAGTLISPDGKQAYNPESDEIYDIYQNNKEEKDDKEKKDDNKVINKQGKESLNNLLNDKLGYNIWDTIVKGV